MTLSLYYQTNFLEDLALIPTVKPVEQLIERSEEFFIYQSIRFFGGKDFRSFYDDISFINKLNQENFIFTLLVSTTVNYYIKNNINILGYLKFDYNLPVLGYCGIFPHFEHPYKIIQQWANFKDSNYDLFARKEEIKLIFEFISLEYLEINLEEFKNLIINNLISVPDNFNEGIFFEFLNDDDSMKWKEIISTLIN